MASLVPSLEPGLWGNMTASLWTDVQSSSTSQSESVMCMRVLVCVCVRACVCVCVHRVPWGETREGNGI